MAAPAIRADSDDDLVARVRRGGIDAYDVLYERYAARARRVAGAVLDDRTDVDDVVSEAFASVLGALQRGKGPTQGFAGYLVAAVRHEAYRTNRRRSHHRPVEGNEPTADPFAGHEDAEVLRAAFSSLPTVARDVLWRTEVEGHSHADIARSVGSTSQAIAARAARARDALGGAYLAGHLDLAFDEPPTTPECSQISGQLVDLVRGRASWRRRRALEGHLAVCARCRNGRDRLERLNERLRTAPFMAAAAATSRLALAHGATFVARLASVVAQPLGGALAATAFAAAAMMVPSFGDAGGFSEADQPAAMAAPTPRPAPPDRAETTTTVGSTEPATADADTAAEAGTATGGVAPGPATVGAIPTDPVVQGSLPIVHPPDSTGPLLTVPSITVPSITVPSITVPSIIVPSVAIPPLALPLITTPPITTPAVTLPPITTPPITTPPITTPAITVPAVTLPPITVPPLPGL